MQMSEMPIAENELRSTGGPKKKYKRRYGIECRLMVPRHDSRGNIVGYGGWWACGWYLTEDRRDQAMATKLKNEPAWFTNLGGYEYRPVER